MITTDFDFSMIKIEAIKEDLMANKEMFASSSNKNILDSLLEEIQQIDLRAKVDPQNVGIKIERKHVLIACVDEIMDIAKRNNWGLCKKNGFFYIYNGNYWSLVEEEEIEDFLGKAAEKMGVDKFDAQYYAFREQLFKQFQTTANLPKPNSENEFIKINLLNGTFKISPSIQQLCSQDRNDFMTYQLPFEYDSESKCFLFQQYLNKVLPDLECQTVLAEYIGYLFIKSNNLKLEKALILYGKGANGKSVFFEIITALLGKENISHFALQNLTNETGYSRAMLSNKLVNYASEINTKMRSDVFKQLVSGEPVEARLPYRDPFILTN